MNAIKSHFQSCGREFTQEELSLIQEIVEDCSNLTRTELAGTVCELLDWKRPSGRLKKHEYHYLGYSMPYGARLQYLA